MHETTNKITLNTLYQIIGKVITMSVTIAATIIVTRTFGRQGYGAFSLMQTFPALFFIIADFGLNAIVTRELSKDWNTANRYFSNALFIRILLSLILIFVGSLIILFLPYSGFVKFGIIISMFLILTQALFTTTNIIFQTKLRYDLSTIGLVSGSVIILLLVIFLSKQNADISWISFSYVIGGAISVILNFLLFPKVGFKPSYKVNNSDVRYLLLNSLPLGLMFVFSQINFKADSLLISVLRLPRNLGLSGLESVAIYGLAYKVFEVMLVIPTFVMNSVYPVFVRHLVIGKKVFLRTFFKVLSVMLVIGILVSFVTTFFAPQIIKVLGGSAFNQSTQVLKILMLGMFIFYLTQPISWFIVTLNGQKYLPVIYLLSAIFNVSLNLYFIPKYSFYASSYITWLSELLILILLCVFAHKVWKGYSEEKVTH